MTAGVDRQTDVVAGLLEARLGRSDSAAIEDTIGEFFGAYNMMDFDLCLNYVLQVSAGDGGRLRGLLTVARNLTGPVIVQSVNDMAIEGSEAGAVLSIVLRGEASKKTVELVKDGNSWKLDWYSIAGSFMVAAQLRIKEGTVTES